MSDAKKKRAEQKAELARQALVAYHVASLIRIWYELWLPPVVGLIILLAVGPSWPLTALVASLVVMVWLGLRRHIGDNFRDSYVQVIAWHMHNQRARDPKYPILRELGLGEFVGWRVTWKLVAEYGPVMVPFSPMEMVVRPDESETSPSWDEKFAQRVQRRWGFAVAEASPDVEDTNRSVITAVAKVMPDKLIS